MNALNQHSGRWHEVTFALPSVYLRRLCGTSPPKNLQNLSISDTVYANAANTSLRFTMNTRPGPIKFTADTIPLKAVDIAWDRLVQLDVRSTSLDGVLQVIRDAPLLEICSLSWMFPPTDVFPTSETIVRHQHLRTLKLLWSQNTVYTKFIDSLELPSLESWRFESEENLITVDAISFLKRSGSGLKTLHILQDQAPTFEDFERFLQAAPHLQCLIVVDKANAFSESLVMDNILERIAIPPSACTAILLPDLQSLKLIGSKLNSWVCIPLIFRWPHRKLLTLVIKMESIEIRDEVSRTLVQLVDEGIDLRIFDSDEDYISRFRRLLSTP
jgi:hypothetical protein